MADKLYKVSEVIELGYQAPNKQSGLVNVVAEIYLPNKAKDTNYPDVVLVEIGTTGTYRGEFTPDEQGTWQVLMHKADGDGQVTKSYSVGAYNVHSVGEGVTTVDGKVVTLDGKVVTVDGKVDTVNTNMAKDATVAKEATVAKAADLATTDGKVVTVDSKVVTVTGKVDAVQAAIDALDTKVSSLDTPPMAF